MRAATSFHSVSCSMKCLTGKRAFEGASAASVIAAILERPAPSIVAVAPPALDRLLQLCLKKDPDDRWRSARDLRNELHWIAEAGVAAVSAGGRRHGLWRSRLGWMAAAALGAASLFLSLYDRSGRDAGNLVRLTINPPEKSLIVSETLGDTMPVQQFAISRTAGPSFLWPPFRKDMRHSGCEHWMI
jgi:hypothetical protein